MTKPLQVPNEARFVSALAQAVDPGDTLNLLLEIGALGSQDLAIVRRTREALAPAYDRASDGPLPGGNGRDWEQTYATAVLQQALAAPDSVAYLAYHTRGFSPGEPAERFAQALAIVGCAADALTSPRRPWEVEHNDLALPHWRELIWRLLSDLPGNALPRPPASTPHEPSSPQALGDGHVDLSLADGEVS